MKRVLHIFNEINFSGAELMYEKAAPLFQENNWILFAISTGDKIGEFTKEFEKKSIKVYHKPISQNSLSPLRVIRYYYKFYKFLKSKKIDVLHIHRSDIYLMALCARLAKIRTIKTMHNKFVNRKFTLPYAITKKNIARNLLNVKFQTIGESVYNNELYYYKNPSIRINNWFDASSFYKPTEINEKRELRKKLGIKANAFVVISVGGCSSIKNHHDIIKAINLVKGQIEIEYLHLGTGDSEKSEIQLAKELNIIDNIKFLGNKKNVRDYLISSDVYVMSSKFEGLSIACIEAMACSLPLILYNSPGLKDLIKNNDNGFLIEPNYNLLAEKIIVYHNNVTLMNEKGINAYNHVNEHYSMGNGVRKKISLYNNEI